MVEVPELLERLIEEAQLFIAVEDRDGRRELVERIGVASDHALVFLADRLDFAFVERNAGRTLAGGIVGHRKDVPVALDHGRQRLLEDRPRQMLLTDRLAGLGSEEFLAVADGGLRIGRFDGCRIGAVDPFQPAVGRPDPERHVERVDQADHVVVIDGQPLVFEFQPRLHALSSRTATGSAR